MPGEKQSSQRALGQFKAPFKMGYGRLSLEVFFCTIHCSLKEPAEIAG